VQQITISGDVVAAEATPQPVVETAAPAVVATPQPVVAAKATPVAKKAKASPKTNTKKAVASRSKK
jgi:hypothetical protein